MKQTILFSLLLLLSFGVSMAETTKENKKRKTVLARAAEMEKDGVENKVFDVQKKEQRSMLDGMTILGSTGQWTVVPSNAFLSKLPILTKYVLEKPKGSYTQWPEFSRRNRGWLTSHEVSIETIKGEDPITEKELEAFKRSLKVVVATYKNSPVSILPAQPKSKE